MTEEFDPAPGDLIGWSYQDPNDPDRKSSGQYRWTSPQPTSPNYTHWIIERAVPVPVRPVGAEWAPVDGEAQWQIWNGWPTHWLNVLGYDVETDDLWLGRHFDPLPATSKLAWRRPAGWRSPTPEPEAAPADEPKTRQGFMTKDQGRTWITVPITEAEMKDLQVKQAPAVEPVAQSDYQQAVEE